MTVVAAIARDGHVTMGADRATNYQDTVILGARKIARIGTGPNEMLLAASGSGSLLALRHGWTVDNFPKATAPRDIQDWADHIATALTELAATATPPILNENRLPGAFLLGWRGRLIYLFAHQATIVPEGVAGLGIGTDYALGYIEAILRAAPSNDDAIIAEMAVYGACERYDGCRVGSEPPLIEQIGAGAP